MGPTGSIVFGPVLHVSGDGNGEARHRSFVDADEAPEELFAMAAVIAGFLLLVAALGVAVERGRARSEAARMGEELAALRDAFLADPILSDGGCLDARALNLTADLARLSPSRSYEVLVSDIATRLQWTFGDGVRGDSRVSLSAACIRYGRDLVTAARVSVAVGE